MEVPRPQREAFIASACGSDRALRAELTSLLEAHDAADAYFDALSERVLAPTITAIAATAQEAAESAMMERLQAVLVDTYRFERELGGGGMSRILVAEDLRLKRRVVIKVLPPETVPTAGAERFQREIELAAQLQHPHIVPLLAADVVDGASYYTMPLVAGESLRDRLAREGPLPLQDALRIWHDVLDALAHAHAHGVIHRDIKPGNILVSGRHALVTDFGIAVALEKSAAGDAVPSKPEMAIGTPAYMAPEQARGAPGADARVDIYQAGLVMYEMLTGDLPFGAKTARELLLARVDSEPRPLSGTGTPTSLADLVMRCLARAPAQRPQTANAVLAELEAIATAEMPSPAAGDVVGTSRKRRTSLYAAAAIAVLALAAVAVRALLGPAPAPFATGIGGGNPAAGVSSASRHTPDIAAYEWYLRGMDVALLRSDRGRRQAVTYFERAIAIDSRYAAAYAGLSRMYVQIWNAAPRDERHVWWERAEQAALRAVALDDSNADAQAALGWVRLASGDYASSEAALRRALELDPAVRRGHEGLARVYMVMGKTADQMAQARLGVAADPFSHSAIREMALALATNGRCEEALDQLRPLKTLTPPAAVAGVVGGMCYGSRERWPEAIAELRWAASVNENSAASAPAFLGYALARAGYREEASAILSDLLEGREDSHGAFGIATVYTGMRDYDQAFAWLHRALDERSVTPYLMHPIFADLHLDPRFERLRARMGLAPS